MFFTLKKVTIAFILFSITLSAHTVQKRFAARVIAGLDPIGILTHSEEYSSAYGLTPGIEMFLLLSPSVQIGLGFQYQIPRNAFSEYGPSYGQMPLFHFFPLYFTVRGRIVTLKRFRIILGGKTGYAFFREYTGIWNPIGGNTTSYVNYFAGGLFFSVSLGALYNLKETDTWGLDLSLETGFEFALAFDTSPVHAYMVNYRGMNVALGLQLRW